MSSRVDSRATLRESGTASDLGEASDGFVVTKRASIFFLRRGDPGVSDTGGHGASTQLAVVGVGEAVGFVAHALEEVQLG